MLSWIAWPRMRIVLHSISVGPPLARARDPILRFEERLRVLGLLDDGSFEELIGRIEGDIDDALAFADSAPYPDPATLRHGVYADDDTGGAA